MVRFTDEKRENTRKRTDELSKIYILITTNFYFYTSKNLVTDCGIAVAPV